jgi:hypothetical protein
MEGLGIALAALCPLVGIALIIWVILAATR